jgi:fatty acid desaturase
MELFRLVCGRYDLKRVMMHCFGRMETAEKDYIPKSEFKKVYWEARAWVLIFLVVIAACIYTRSILPAIFIGLPTFYGFALAFIVALTQHLGLNEDVLDHRLNTRTVYMNPVIRFLYWNINYHIEHHMFPMVPYHALLALHEERLTKRYINTKSNRFWVRGNIQWLRKKRTGPIILEAAHTKTTACLEKIHKMP